MFRHDPAAMMAAAGALLCAAMIAQATAAPSHIPFGPHPPAAATPFPTGQSR